MTHEVDAEQFCDVLRVELEALARLAHTLEVQGLVLRSGRLDLLAESGRDVEDALGDVREADLLRAITASRLQLAFLIEAPGSSAADHGYLTLGMVADAAGPTTGPILRSIGDDLRRALARVMSFADDNAKQLSVAREAVEASESATRPDPWEPASAEASIDDFLDEIAQGSDPDEFLSDVEAQVFSAENKTISAAVAELALQAVTVDAALGVLQGVGCRPLLEFITEHEDARS